MIYFNYLNQGFHNLTPGESPGEEWVEITGEQHGKILEKLNQGYYVFKDLTTSPRRPSIHHQWTNSGWVDPRTPEEIEAQYLASLRKLTARQFKLALLHFDMLELVQTKINEIEDVKLRNKLNIEYSEATEFHRNSESILLMSQLLGLTSNQVNSMWEYGLTQ